MKTLMQSDHFFVYQLVACFIISPILLHPNVYNMVTLDVLRGGEKRIIADESFLCNRRELELVTLSSIAHFGKFGMRNLT